MQETIEIFLRPAFAVAAVLYLALAVRVARTSVQHGTSVVSVFLFLIGIFITGAAFATGTSDPDLYGIGRVLVLFATGFMPVAFYVVYRDYTVGPPNAIFIAMLSVVPIATTALAMTNSMHNLIWAVVETESGPGFSNLTDHSWFNQVFAPFTFGLFGYSLIALAGRLPSIASAHRKTVVLLLVCAALPYAVSMCNTLIGIGPPDFPFLASTIVILFPVYYYLSISMRFYDFSPLAYPMLFDHVRDPIIVLDMDQRIICANRSAEELLGGTENELIGQQLWEDFPEARAILKQANDLDLTQTLRMNMSQIYELSVGPLIGPKGQNMGMVIVCRDVTERRNALSKLAESEHLIRTLIETSSNGILRFSRDFNDGQRRFRCIFANRAAESYLGSSSGTLVGMPLDKLEQLEPDRLNEHFADESSKIAATSFEAVADSLTGQNWLRIVAEPVGNDFSVTLIDITQRKHNEDKMLADALHDPLTSVLNRRGFEKEGAERIRDYDIGAVLYLDLNHFKSINDRFGHQAGDALLKAFGHRLEFCLRPEDVLGRLGGDEFAIVLPGISVEDAKHVAARLVQAAFEAYIIQGQEITCAASVGIALMPKHGEELWHLISVADQAMYDAKSMSKDDAANDCAAYVEAATAL
jgi:diguanylate cyclase (GGDEF)-like protein/PAS domain S-box-containing protein